MECSGDENERETKNAKASSSSYTTSLMREIVDSHAGSHFLFADNVLMPVYCIAPYENPEDLRDKVPLRDKRRASLISALRLQASMYFSSTS